MVDIGGTLAYSRRLHSLHLRFGPTLWPLLYQAESRCRLEHMEPLRRTAIAGRNKAIAAGGSHDFDPARPWNSATKAAKDDQYWDDKFTDHVLLVAAQAKTVSAAMGGDHLVDSGKRSARSSKQAAVTGNGGVDASSWQ